MSLIWEGDIEYVTVCVYSFNAKRTVVRKHLTLALTTCYRNISRVFKGAIPLKPWGRVHLAVTDLGQPSSYVWTSYASTSRRRKMACTEEAYDMHESDVVNVNWLGKTQCQCFVIMTESCMHKTYL